MCDRQPPHDLRARGADEVMTAGVVTSDEAITFYFQCSMKCEVVR